MKSMLIGIVGASLVLTGLIIPAPQVEAQVPQGTQTQQNKEPEKAGPYRSNGTTDLDDFEDVTNPKLGSLDDVTTKPQQNDRQIVNSSEWVTFGSIESNRFFTDNINARLRKQIKAEMLYAEDPAHAGSFYSPSGRYLRWINYSDADLVRMGLRKIKINRRFEEVLWSKIGGVLKFRVVNREAGTEIWAADVVYDKDGGIVSFTPVCDGYCRNPAPWIAWRRQVVRETVTQQCVVTSFKEDESKRIDNGDSVSMTLVSNCGQLVAVTIPKAVKLVTICKGGFNLVAYTILGVGDHPNHANIAKAKRFKLKEEVDMAAAAIAEQFAKRADEMDKQFINNRSIPELTTVFLNGIHSVAPETNDAKQKAKILQIWQNVCEPGRFLVFWYDEKGGWHWKEFFIGMAIGFVGGFLLCHFMGGGFELLKPNNIIVTSP